MLGIHILDHLTAVSIKHNGMELKIAEVSGNITNQQNIKPNQNNCKH